MEIDGLVLESRWPQLQYIVKGPIEDTWRDGMQIRRPKHIVLEFDRHLLVMDDLARQKEWTEEDKVFIGRQLDYELKRPDFVDFWEHKPPMPNPPWPTYDKTDAKNVPTVAQSTGLILESIRYEKTGRPGGPREDVVAKLEALQRAAEGQTFETVDDDLLAAE